MEWNRIICDIEKLESSLYMYNMDDVTGTMTTNDKEFLRNEEMTGYQIVKRRCTTNIMSTHKYVRTVYELA